MCERLPQLRKVDLRFGARFACGYQAQDLGAPE